MKDVFIETKNYQRLKELCDELLGACLQVELAAVTGKAGRGKTWSAERIYTHTDTAVYMHCGVKWSVSKLYREIAFVLGGKKPRLRDASENIIRDELSSRRRIILADDAHRLSIDCLNVLRDIQDLGAPVIMIGEEKLNHKINREGGIKSRVRKTLRFEPVCQADVVVWYRQALGQQLPPEYAVKLLRSAQGDFRNILTQAVKAERIMKASGITAITERVVDEVCKKD